MRRGNLVTVALSLLAQGGVGCAAPIEQQDIVYDDRHGDATSLDLYLPDDGATGRPGIMFIHGGAWAIGDKFEYLLAARRMGGSGFVAATINYRLGEAGVYPAAIQDARCALAFMRSKSGAWGMDPDRLAVLGYSSGGHLASMLGVADGVPELEPDCAAGTTGAANAVVAGAGIHDLEAMGDDSSVQDFLGGGIGDLPDRYRLASPIRHVEAGEPPYLLIHGGSDWLIDEEQSERMRDALVAAGNEARLMSLEDSGHLLASGPDVGSENFGTVNDRPESWIAVIDFLHETLGPP